jgi:tRNA (guanine-N7-)-methyltransferase
MSDFVDPILVPTDYFRELAPHEIFADCERPLELDLGSGDGTFLVEMAALHPERNFLGVERLLGRVEKTAKRIRQRGLKNVRVLRLETTYTVAWLLPANLATRIHLLCPDPWPKKKHHGRRLLNDAEFLAGLHKVLRDGGEFLVKTDDQHYYEHVLEVMGGQARFQRLDWPDDAFPYPKTDFEQQWLALSKPMERARWRKLSPGS